MTLSFRYPPNLLHSLIEPQWFHRPKSERQSSLDVLDHDEETHLDSIRKVVLPKAPEPIGIAGGTDEVKQQYSSTTTSSTADDISMIMPPPPHVSFWVKYQSEISQMEKKRDDPESDSSTIEQLPITADADESFDIDNQSGDMEDKSSIVDLNDTDHELDTRKRLDKQGDDDGFSISKRSEQTMSFARHNPRLALYSPIGRRFHQIDPPYASSEKADMACDTSSILSHSMSSLTPASEVRLSTTTDPTSNQRSNARYSSTLLTPANLSYNPRGRASLSSTNASLSFGLDTPTSRTG